WPGQARGPRSGDDDDDLAAGVAFLYLAEGERDVGEGVGPVDDGAELALVDERGDGGEFGAVLAGGQDAEALPDDGVDRGQPEHRADRADEVAGRAAGVEHEGSGGGEHAAEQAQRTVAYVVQDHVVAGGR